MSQSIANRLQTTPDNLDVIGRPRMAHVDNPVRTTLSPVVKEAAQQAFGKQEAAAAHLGKDKGNFSRDTDSERLTLRQLRELGPTFLAKFGQGLVEQFAPLVDPKEEARRALAEIDRAKKILEQFVDVA